MIPSRGFTAFIACAPRITEILSSPVAIIEKAKSRKCQIEANKDLNEF
jgi:hypothetical protein